MGASKGKGQTHRWLVDHVNYPHDGWCLIWPFAKTRGYGHFSYLGVRHYSHRFMCELVNGPAPSDVHEAAHACGDNSCANPHHLSWKTPTENMLDCREHGTSVRSRFGNVGKITREQAEEIRSLKDISLLRELAEKFDVSESTISNIWVGRTHSRDRRAPPRWTGQEDSELKILIGIGGVRDGAIAGRTAKAMNHRIVKLGLRATMANPLSPADRGTP